MLKGEVEEWKHKPYSRYLSFDGAVHAYSIVDHDREFEVEIHTKRNTTTHEIIVMVEVSKKALLGTSLGEARYFAVSTDDRVRDATPDEAF